MLGDKTKHLVSQGFTGHATVTFLQCDKVFSDVAGIRLNIPYRNAQLLFIRAVCDFVRYQRVAETATNLIQDRVTNVISENLDLAGSGYLETCTRHF